MAGRFVLTHDVSDLCIGKPPLRWLPASSTVADAIAELDGGGPDAAVAVWDGHDKGAEVSGRVRMADVVFFLCADDGGSTLLCHATLADLLAAAGDGAPTVGRVEPHASVLEAVDAFLGGAHILVVPIRDHRRRSSSSADGETMMCWLTVEDVVRFFLGSVALFSPIASRSVSVLGAVRPAITLSVSATENALSVVLPLLRTSLSSHASVAVVSGGRLEGEISASTLCSLDPSVAASAFAALSAGELAAFLDCGRAHQEANLRVVRSRLRRRSLHGMLDLLDGGHDDPPPSPFSSSSSSLWSSSSASSCSSEDDDEEHVTPAYTRTKQGKFSAARWVNGRREAREPVACRPGSSLVAVMAQAVTHRVSQVWVVDDVDGKQELVGVVGFLDVLRVLRRHLLAAPPAPI